VPRASLRIHDNVWSPSDASKFMAAVKNSGSAQYAALFRLAWDAGMRKGELLGLQWKDIEGSCVHVRRQLMGVTDVNGVFKLDTSLPKGKSTRDIHLADETVALLREHKRQQAELKLKNRLHYVDLDLVFAREWEHGRRTARATVAPFRNSVRAEEVVRRERREAHYSARSAAHLRDDFNARRGAGRRGSRAVGARGRGADAQHLHARPAGDATSSCEEGCCADSGIRCCTKYKKLRRCQ
jgi:hypothetical protein